MSRRLLFGLAVVSLLLGLAGCSAAGSISMEPVDDGELAQRASVDLPGARGPPGVDRDVARRAVENGTATTAGERPPVDTDRVYRHRGAFYRLSTTVVGSEPGRAVDYRLNVSVTEADAEAAGWTVVDYDALPSVDRESLAPIVTTDVPASADRDEVNFAVVYREPEFEASRLVTGEVDAVRHDGDLYRLAVRDRENRTLDVYRYEATTVAESAEAYARQLRDEYEFELSGLSDAERSVVEEATDGAYYAEDDDDEGFGALVDRFRSREAVNGGDTDGNYVVRYDGQLYWVEMRFGAFVDDA